MKKAKKLLLSALLVTGVLAIPATGFAEDSFSSERRGISPGGFSDDHGWSEEDPDQDKTPELQPYL